MRKILIVVWAAAALAGLVVLTSGCGGAATADSRSLSSEKYAQIDIGMGQDQVKTIAGEPEKTESKSMGGGHSMGGGSMSGDAMTMEYWYYQGSKGWVRFEISDGKVSAKSGY